MRVGSDSSFASARRALRKCAALGPRTFAESCSGRRFPLKRFSVDFAPLIDLGLIDISMGEAQARTPLIAFDGLFFKCDAPHFVLRDRVFPLHEDESLLLARWIAPERDERVLEIGTGAGIAALRAAALGAQKVVATDVNPRVRDYFAFNSAINGLEGKVEYVESDVFEGIGSETFDVIACNPPFVPVPKEARFFLHSDGGPLGTSILEKLSATWRKHLEKDGRLYLLGMSLGGRDGWRVPALFPGAKVTPVYEKPDVALHEFLHKFDDVRGFEPWQKMLIQSGFDRIGYFALMSGGDSEESWVRLRTIVAHGQCVTPWPAYSWSMASRLQRYGSRPRQL